MLVGCGDTVSFGGSCAELVVVLANIGQRCLFYSVETE
jgi:hypothetical protein